MSEIIIPKSLKTAFKNNEVILFVGSGLSIDLGLPNWDGLVNEIIDYIVKETNTTDLNLFKDILAVRQMTAIDVLTQIEKKHKKLAFDYLGGKRLRLKESIDLSLHKNLFDLCPRIITTNYDHAFELAIGDTIHKISNSSIYGISNLERKPEYLFKIHGDINDPDECVLFQSAYENLYTEKGSKQELFTGQFKNLILNKTLLFIGFSLNDPYVKEIMDHVNTISNSMLNKHYLITTDTKFNIPYIEPIILEDYKHLSGVIDQIKNELIDLENCEVEVLSEDVVKDTIEIKDTKITSVKLLVSEPIDKDYEFNIELFSRTFSKYEIELRSRNLNLEELRSCEDNYLVVFSKVVKGNLIIEDEYLRSKQISHTDLFDNISSNTSGVLIFTNEFPHIETNVSDIPYYYVIEEKPNKIKAKLDSIFYKFFKKKGDFCNDDENKVSNSSFKVENFKKGKPRIEIDHFKLSKYIDKKLLTNFVGRKTDVENIVRKIIDLEFESKILTIKGSGGIGKTTIIIKSVLELAKRNLYHSIQYISCQSIASYENFKYQIASSLDFDSATDLEDQIINCQNKNNTVIILDNFETLLQLNEKDKILNLVATICDNYLIVTTTRQLLGLDFEEVYELRNLTTDEGEELFVKYYKGNINKKDKEILRYDIVENLLNNNPLAIKIISKGIPKSKDIESLSLELKNNIFNNENINKIFEKPEDINIEKSNSLFYSIKYSYDKLNPNEKFAFELLSLFPDGIHIENLKKFAKQNERSKTKVTDKEIKSLDDKSLLENSSGFLKLQSIVNRFSAHQFGLRSDDIKKSYYSLCFEYNYFFITFIQSVMKTSDSLPMQDDNINNYLKCLEFLKYIENSNEDKIDYIDSLALFFRNINQHKEFISIISKDNFYSQFQENTNENKLLKMIILKLIYWCQDFDVVDEIREIFNDTELKNLDVGKKLDKLIYVNLFNTLTCEGESLKFVEDRINRWYLKQSIVEDLFRIGLINLSSSLIKYQDEITFIDFDILSETGKLKPKELDDYISNLYQKETMEIIQSNYVKIKNDVSLSIDTTSFIVSNPYTDGMICLISALMEPNKELKIKNFEKAIKKLKHIKYYYVEAIYHYSKFLNDDNCKNLVFDKYFKLGLKISEQYSFWFLNFKFNKILDDSLVYNENETYKKFQKIERATFDLFIEQYISVRKKALKGR